MYTICKILTNRSVQFCPLCSGIDPPGLFNEMHVPLVVRYFFLLTLFILFLCFLVHNSSEKKEGDKTKRWLLEELCERNCSTNRWARRDRMSSENCKMAGEDRTNGLCDDDADDDVVVSCKALHPQQWKGLRWPDNRTDFAAGFGHRRWHPDAFYSIQLFNRRLDWSN